MLGEIIAGLCTANRAPEAFDDWFQRANSAGLWIGAHAGGSLARGLAAVGRHADGMVALCAGLAPLVDGSVQSLLEESDGDVYFPNPKKKKKERKKRYLSTNLHLLLLFSSSIFFLGSSLFIQCW